MSLSGRWCDRSAVWPYAAPAPMPAAMNSRRFIRFSLVVLSLEMRLAQRSGLASIHRRCLLERARQCIGGDRRSPIRFNVLDYHLGPALVAHKRAAGRVIHGVGQIADQNAL